MPGPNDPNDPMNQSRIAGSAASMAAQAAGAAGVAPDAALSPTEKADRFRGMVGYGMDTPETTLQNIWLDQGKGWGIGNPFMQFMKRVAQPLALAFMAKASQAGNGTEIAQNPFAFRDFMTQAIGPGGGAFTTMANTANSLPGLVDSLKGMDMSANLEGANPFLGMLSSALEDRGGQGTADFLSTLRAPMMGRATGEAYSLANRRRAAMGLREFMGKEGEPEPTGNIWDYLLPRGPGR